MCCPCSSSPRCRCSRRPSRSRPPPPSPRTPRPRHREPITVAAARATQDGSTATVRGYVVGQPTVVDHRGHQRLPQRLRAGAGRHGRHHRHQPDALRPDPERVPVGLGAEVQPRPDGPADRRHRHPRGVLLPPGPDLRHRLRVRRRRGRPRPGGGGPYDDTYYADAIGKTGAAARVVAARRSSPPATPRSPTTPSGTPSRRPTRTRPTAPT